MCGIAGIVHTNQSVDSGTLAAMCQAMEHRGPDDHGLYISHDTSLAVGLGSQRLSILDLSQAGHMPMSNEVGDVVVTYNGEIYNHRELRAGLELRGYRYRSRTDTETVLHAYQAYGLDCLPRFNGMFAIAIHDRRNNQVVIARDRMGIKPVYYFWDGQTLAFASELKALLVLPRIQRRIDRHALNAYLSLGYVPAPYTLIEGISKLPAGSYLLLKEGRLKVVEFWQSSYDTEATGGWSDKELIELTRQTLEDTVQRQLMSDVPVGVLLSGGLDSTIVAALVRKYHNGPIDTFSVGFESHDPELPIAANYNDDRHYAALAAQRLGTRHHEIIVTNGSGIGDLFQSLARSLDEPVWEASFLSIYLLCRLAREHGVKVVLTGDGSDEIFAGYPWYRGAQRLLFYDRVPFLGTALPSLAFLFQGHELGRKAVDLQQKLRRTALERYRVSYDHFSSAEKAALLGASTGGNSHRDSVDALVEPLLARARGPLAEQFAFADLRLWVGEHFNQRLDRMSAACSVEARVPFQDNAVLDLGLSIPVRRKIKAGEHKYLLRHAFADVLPPEILRRPKRPFAAPQYAWFRSSLRRWAEDLLSEERILAFGMLEPGAVQQVLQQYISGQEDRVQKISILIMFQLWCEEVFRTNETLEILPLSRIVADCI